VDNADVKSALATLDSCGDSLCGDGRTSKQLIDRYTKRPTVVVLVDKNKSESKSK
jgi:16S rRNA C1402 (ribose-2'-O) methylase RsmI